MQEAKRDLERERARANAAEMSVDAAVAKAADDAAAAAEAARAAAEETLAAAVEKASVAFRINATRDRRAPPRPKPRRSTRRKR